MVMNRNGNRLPAQTGPVPSMKLGHRGHFEGRPDQDDADREQQDRADLEEGRQIVARREQEPHRQHRGDEAVADDEKGKLRPGEGERGGQRRRLGDRLAVDEPDEQQRGADGGHLADSPRSDEAAVEAHEERDRNGAGDREGPPRAAFQRIHHDEGEHRQEDHADQDDADSDHAARRRTDRNLPSLLAANAVIVFTEHLQDSAMLSLCKETGRRKTLAGTLPT